MNNQRFKKRFITQLLYLIIFILQMIIVVIEALLVNPEFKHKEPNLNHIKDKTFFWVAFSGILLQPFFLHHIYSVTHREEMAKKNEKINKISQDTDDLYEANRLA